MTTNTAPTDVDLGLLGRLMLQVEQHVHRFGWDQPVQTRVVYDHTVDPDADRFFRRICPPGDFCRQVRLGPYVASTLFGPRVLHALPGVPPWETLRTMAVNIAYGDGDDNVAQMRAALDWPGLVGFLTVGEAWHNTEQTDVHCAIRGEVNLGDVPGSVECRVVYGVDLADRAHRAQRVRGRKPELDMEAPMRGDVTTSMRIIADAVTGRTPPPDQFAARYPTLSDLVESGAWAGLLREMKSSQGDDAGTQP